MDGFSVSLRSLAKHERDHKGEVELAGIIDCAADRMESDAKVIAALREALSGIADYCSGDGQPLGAIDRLVAVRNTAYRALAAANEQEVGE